MDVEGRFEADVRRLARALFGDDAGGGPANVVGRERDSVFFHPERVVIVEATTSGKKEKVKHDAEKTKQLVLKYRLEYPDRFVEGIVITQSEPTSDQRDAFKNITNTT